MIKKSKKELEEFAELLKKNKKSKQEKKVQEDTIEEILEKEDLSKSKVIQNNTQITSERLDMEKIILKSDEETPKRLENSVANIPVKKEEKEEVKYSSNQEVYQQRLQQYESRQMRPQITTGREILTTGTIEQNAPRTIQRLIPTEIANSRRLAEMSGRELIEYTSTEDNKHKTHLDKVAEDLKYR